MKTIAASILALAILAVSGMAVGRSIHRERAAAEEQCVGLSCWPNIPPTKHRPAHRAELQPVW
jgi:hypothetical protein